MKYDRDTAAAAIANSSIEVLPFYGHDPAVPGIVDASCLSQWFSCAFSVDGIEYHTAEQYMMSEKARVFRDDEIRRMIMESDSPKEYKALGRKVHDFVPEVWDHERCEVVYRGNLAKFAQNPDLLSFLVGTGNSILVEASPRDSIWGAGLCISSPDIKDPKLWRGRNLLGFTLMRVRDELQQ